MKIIICFSNNKPLYLNEQQYYFIMNTTKIFLPRTFLKLFSILGLLFIFSNQSLGNVDTIYASIPTGQFGSNCIDASNFPGDIASITNLCPDSSGTFALFSISDIGSGCINYFGISYGSSLGCFEICDDQQNCDTLHLYLNTEIPAPLAVNCDTLIAPEVLNMNTADCALGLDVCLPLRLDQLSSLEIYNNGVLYDNGITGCAADTIIAYTYSNLFGQGTSGPYVLESWSINGTEFSGDFPDINALLDSMNVWDTLGTWHFDTIVPFTIVGGFSENFYGSIIASRPGIVNSTSIMGTNYGLSFLGSEINLPVGQNEITIVDNANTCSDTITINIACIPNDFMTLQTYVDLSGSICIDTSDLLGNFVSLENACPETTAPNMEIDIFPNDVCVDWTTLVEGTSEVCLVACDDLGFCDTTFITFNIVDPTPDTIDVTMDENDTYFHCVDSTELFSIINSYVVSDSTSSTASITLDTVDFCLEIQSTVAGNDFGCVVICDDQGGCDTTCFNITVGTLGGGDPPIANDDIDTTAFDTPITMQVLNNDSNTVIGDSFVIITDPTNGTLTFDSLGNYLYTPNPGTCGVDSYVYEICNDYGCDQATVTIHVLCDEVVVYNGFSPNGDNLNDTFTIRGLNGHPNNRVCVYNRWGNLVYQGDDYQNDWKGDWNGNFLPAGSYFYVIDLNDTNGTQYSGLLYLAK